MGIPHWQICWMCSYCILLYSNSIALSMQVTFFFFLFGSARYGSQGLSILGKQSTSEVHLQSLVLLRQGLATHCPGWPCTYNPSTMPPQILGLHKCPTMPSTYAHVLNTFFFPS
jgi:hypothetical protein